MYACYEIDQHIRNERNQPASCFEQLHQYGNAILTDDWPESVSEWQKLNFTSCEPVYEKNFVDSVNVFIPLNNTCDVSTRYFWYLIESGLFYHDNVMDLASYYDHVYILEWRKNWTVDMHYSKFAMHMAAIRNNINVLDWWMNSGLELKYDIDILESASKSKKYLKWWNINKSHLQNIKKN
jgi:hypothetical protein